MTVTASEPERGLLVEVDGARATVVIDRPARRNAVDLATLRLLARAFDDLAAHEQVVVTVLRGSGGTFCAGADVGDLGSLLERTDADLRSEFDEQLRTLGALSTSGALTIAAVEGVALGMGVALAASCDVVVAAESARFGLPEVKLGMAPAMVVSSLLRRVALGRAAAWAAAGTVIGAVEARELGLVDVVVADGDVDVALDALADPVASNDAVAVRHTVELVRRLAASEAVDLADESCRALRSPAVAAALAQMTERAR